MTLFVLKAIAMNKIVFGMIQDKYLILDRIAETTGRS
jgi:hypothetical protein